MGTIETMAGNIGSRKLYSLLLGVVIVGLIGLGKLYMQSSTGGQKTEMVSKIAVQKPIISSNSADQKQTIPSNSAEKKQTTPSNSAEKKPDSSLIKTDTQNADAKNIPEKLINTDSKGEIQGVSFKTSPVNL